MPNVVAFLALLALASAVAASCPSARNAMWVPAVSDEGRGLMLLVESEVREGRGLVYMATTPLAGLLTQQSENTAVKVAFREAGRNRSACDVLFRIEDTGVARSVDGPSAGAAMAVLTLAGLLNRSVQDDITITGRITEDGRIASVGGLLAKAAAAEAKGMRALIVPEAMDSEAKVELLAFSLRKGLAIVEVGDVREAAEIAFAPPKKIETRLELGVRQTPSLRPLPEPAGGAEKFAEVVREMVRELEAEAGNAKVAGEHFLGEAEFARSMAASNYYYTAGNAAFLAGIHLALLQQSASVDSQGLARRLAEVRNCSQKIAWRKPTAENFELLAAAQLRAGWSERKAREAGEALREDNEASLLRALKDTLYAEGWCRTAQRLNERASESGRALHTEGWKEMAEMAIAEAEAALGQAEGFEEERWHLESARELHARGEYAAAIIDALYAKTSALATEEAKLNAGKLREVAGRALLHNASSLLAGIYSAHAYYYYQLGDERSALSALWLARYARALEEAAARMKGTVPQEEVLGKALALGAAIFLLVLVLAWLVRKRV
ncbi:MAG: S16 family serine protease [Candidatus Micrarchaeia archaeon]